MMTGSLVYIVLQKKCNLQEPAFLLGKSVLPLTLIQVISQVGRFQSNVLIQYMSNPCTCLNNNNNNSNIEHTIHMTTVMTS